MSSIIDGYIQNSCEVKVYDELLEKNLLEVLRSSYDQIVFPYEYAKYLMFFAFGVISMGDFMKFGIVKTIVHIIVAFAILIPWWMFTGFLYV